MLEGVELKTIGKYEILGPLGRGSMGLVYKGRDPEIGRLVAIKTLRKLLPTNINSTDNTLDRFRNEARSAGNLRHPHIITIFDVNRDGDTPYIVMDFVEGEPLDALIGRIGKLPLDLTLHYLFQVAAGLDYAHSKGVVHKDIKPGNILVDRNNNVFILDFGIASINESIPSATTGPTPTMGTPGYMSPEQILNKRVEAKSDLFSLAIVTFECLTGKRPFPGNSLTEVVGNILQGKPISLTALDPELPLALEAEIERALSKEPFQRFDSAVLMLEAFTKAAGLEDRMQSGFFRMENEKAEPWEMPRSSNPPRIAESVKHELPINLRRIPSDDQLPAVSSEEANGSARPVESGGWKNPASPGELFAHDDKPLVSDLLDSTQTTPLRVFTVFFGVLTIAFGVVLLVTVVRRTIWPKPQPLPIEVGQTVDDAPPETFGELMPPAYDRPPVDRAVADFTDRQLIGAMVIPGQPESAILTALSVAAGRRLPALTDACAILLDHDSYVVRIEAIKAVTELGDRRIVPKLLLRLDDHDPLVRLNAARALGELGSKSSLGLLTRRMVAEEVAEVKRTIKNAIEKINGFPVNE